MRISTILAAACLVLIAPLCAPVSAKLVIMPLPPVPAPEPGPGWVRIWVPAEYHTVYDRVWVAEQAQRVQERVWVPAENGWRTEIYYDESGRCHARWEWAEISPAHWETQWRTIVVPAHYQTIARQELVHDGYWKWVQVDPPVPPPMPPSEPRPVYRNPPEVGVEGYQSTPTEDLNKFSPLYEWPDSSKK